MAVKLICEDCGALFTAAAAASYCPSCRHERLSRNAKLRQLSRIGREAYSRQQAQKGDAPKIHRARRYILPEYDRRALGEARQRISAVYNYHYSAPGASRIMCKLETLIRKIDAVLGEVTPDE